MVTVVAKIVLVVTMTPSKIAIIVISYHQPPVKKSNSNICHIMEALITAEQEIYPFKTLEECIKSGGRLPKR